MKIKIKSLLFFSIIILIIFETFNNFGIRNLTFKFTKYIITFLVFIICIIKIIQNVKNGKKIDYLFELKRITIVILVFSVISIYKICKTECFTYKTIEEIIQILIPILYTFFIINFMSLKDIFKFMKYILIISIVSYIISIGIGKFTLSNFLKISFINSYSPFESAPFAEIASSLSTFFIYYKKKYPKFAVISFIFCFFVFKRMLLLQAIILFTISILNLNDKFISNIVIFISKFIFIISTLIFNFLLKQENSIIFKNIFNIDIGQFTMGRVYRLWYPLKEFNSYGFGSTTNILGYNLELDLIKILIELGVIALIIFIYNYFDLCRNNLYSFIVIGCVLGNLLFASSLTSTVGWIFRMICIACIYYKRKEWDNINNKVKIYKNI